MLKSMALILIGALVTSAAAQPEERSQQLFDVRDLAAAMVSVPTTTQVVERGKGQSPFRIATDVVESNSRLEMIVGRLGDSMSLGYEWLDDGLLIVEGSNDRLASFGAMLDQLRALYDQTYTVELQAVVVPVGDVPALGGPWSTDATPMHLMRQTVTRRVGTRLVSEQRQSFLADFTPVVGDQSVGFDPKVNEAISGLAVWVIVGAGQEDSSTPVTLVGSIIQTSVSRFDPGPGASSTLPEMPGLELASVQERAFSGAHRVAFGEPTMVAVLDGHQEGEAIVVQVTVVRNDD